ncbi:hypothetical protein HB364_16270 [Pseudoflavitalea sp. X16]|uniref:hypothetical protein n=1 Tax=Paraflavitalea devenefica TaxID=2716334 RepID=UPI001420E801|nr:hypothetical protein [Paraflavitalea devenefica]NII26646.1 hypothetical protein [Paraflavitalea devenefica]
MGKIKLIDQEIIQYLPRLNIRQKQVVLRIIKTFAAQQQDWCDEISEEQQKAIDQSLAAMKAGKLTPHGQIIKNTENGKRNN